MCSQSITSAESVQSVLLQHQKHARHSGQRALVAIEMASQSVVPELHSLNAQRGAHATADTADRVSAWLGTVRHFVVWSTAPGWQLQELAAALGTLAAGGLAVIVYHRQALSESALLARLLAPGVSSPVVHHYVLTQRVHAEAFAAISRDVVKRNTAAVSQSAEALDEQTHLLDQALTHWQTRASQYEAALIVITGPRGSGKSALLGRLQSVLTASGHTCLITGPRKSSCSSLLQFADTSARFVNVEYAALHAPCTVFVDEAASLPIDRLRQLVQQHAHIVMATTIEGYEATGRAFEILALKELPTWQTELPSHVLHLRTQHPMRWQATDPLDQTLREAFLLPRHEFAVCTAANAFSLNDMIIKPVSREELAEKPELARALVDLLNATHYQSSLAATDDVLSGRLGVLVATVQCDVVGAVTLMREASVPSALRQDVIAGKRRLRDRLLPQLLARCANDEAALTEAYLRVVRIAVHPSLQRRGIGRALVTELLSNHSCGMSVGAVYADQERASRFWASLGFTRFHLGQRINPRSGRASAAVMHSNKPIVQSLLNKALMIYNDNQQPSVQEPRTHLDKELLEALASGRRGLAETRAAVWRLWRGSGGLVPPDLPLWPELPGVSSSMTRRQRERHTVQWVKRQLSNGDSPDA